MPFPPEPMTCLCVRSRPVARPAGSSPEAVLGWLPPPPSDRACPSAAPPPSATRSGAPRKRRPSVPPDRPCGGSARRIAAVVRPRRPHSRSPRRAAGGPRRGVPRRVLSRLRIGAWLRPPARAASGRRDRVPRWTRSEPSLPCVRSSPRCPEPAARSLGGGAGGAPSCQVRRRSIAGCRGGRGAPAPPHRGRSSLRDPRRPADRDTGIWRVPRGRRLPRDPRFACADRFRSRRTRRCRRWCATVAPGPDDRPATAFGRSSSRAKGFGVVSSGAR